MGDEGLSPHERLEFLKRRTGIVPTKEMLEAPDPDLAILNSIYCFVTSRKTKPIARFTDDPLNPILYLGQGNLKLVLEGLTHVVGKKRIPLYKWWLSHPGRREEEYV